MEERRGAIASRAEIVVLLPDDADLSGVPSAMARSRLSGGPSLRAAEEIPSGPGIALAKSRMVQDARDWAACRTIRLRLEEQIALQEEFRILTPERADELRGSLESVEERFGDRPVAALIEELSAMKDRLYVADDEHAWW